MFTVRIPRLLSQISSAAVAVSALTLPLLLAGCGGSGSVSGSNPPPSVVMSASPTSISPGASSTVSVTATDATGVTLSGSDGSSYNMSAAGGTQAVSPKATTTYTANASGSGGSVSATATVTVAAAAGPTVTISASPTSITAGGSSTLTVAATDSTAVAISGSDGTSYTVTASGGTQTVSPKATTTYTATATGSGGTTVTATATVTVTAAAATITISANPTSITAGTSTTLTVAATGTSAVAVTGTDGSSYTFAASGGTKSVSPTTTTTYTATGTATGGNVMATAIVTVTAAPNPATVTIVASPTTVIAGDPSTLTVTATKATENVTVSGTDGSSYTLTKTGGMQTVTPSATTTYTATVTDAIGPVTATAPVTVTPAGSVSSINHVIFMLQENHTFDNYLGMLNSYRSKNGYETADDGKSYLVDGIDDKLTKLSNEDDEGTYFSLFKFKTTCIDDETSSWLESYGDVNRYDFATNRPIKMDGFVHDAEGFANSCVASMACSGDFTDTVGQRAMGYYDDQFLNYYYYMASQFAVSNRWFSPVSSKSIPNRIATFSGGTTQGLAFDPGADDKLPQLSLPSIFQSLQKAGVSWKIYYTVTNGYCLGDEECTGASNVYPDTTYSYFSYSFNYLYENPSKAACTGTTQASSVVGDTTNSFCIDPNHIAPLSQYYTDLTNNTLPAFAFIEAGYANNDEHPGSGQSVLSGQYEVANVVNSFMQSSSWSDSVFFLSYDEGGGPYDHVPPVPKHSNQNSSSALLAQGSIPDISTIAVNADGYSPCVPPETTDPTTMMPVPGMATTHCDLGMSDPGAVSTDAPAVQGFAAQLGFRVPNIVISPFTRKHYVSNIPMDHTAIMKFVEDRFIPAPVSYLTARDAAQPNLLDFFDFNGVPWATPPTPPAALTQAQAATLYNGGNSTCTPASMGP